MNLISSSANLLAQDVQLISKSSRALSTIFVMARALKLSSELSTALDVPKHATVITVPLFLVHLLHQLFSALLNLATLLLLFGRMALMPQDLVSSSPLTNLLSSQWTTIISLTIDKNSLSPRTTDLHNLFSTTSATLLGTSRMQDSTISVSKHLTLQEEVHSAIKFVNHVRLPTHHRVL